MLKAKTRLLTKRSWMGRKVTKVFALSCFVVGFLFSCQKDNIIPINIEDLQIKKAKIWFEDELSHKLSFNVFDQSKKSWNLKPIWDIAITQRHSDFTTVEVPVMSLGRFGFATKESRSGFKDSGNEKYIQSVTRFVVLEKEGRHQGFFMTIIPDKEYIESTLFNPLQSTYKKWQKGFSGIILYHHYNGEFSNGWRILNGKVVGTARQNSVYSESASGSKESKDTYLVCYDTFLMIWWQDCTEWFTNGVYTHTTCGPGYMEMVPAYSICDYVEIDGGGGGYNPQSTTPNADQIYHQHSELSPEEKALLEAAIVAFKNLNPIMGTIWEAFLANNIKLIFKVDMTLGEAANVSGDTITFRSQNDINLFNIQEEFVHRYQKIIYGSSFTSIIRNYELEAKTLMNIACQKYNGSCTWYGNAGFLNPSIEAAYTQWVIQISSGADFAINTFNEFCQNWSYPNPAGNYCDPNFLPLVLLTFFGSILY